MDWRWSALALAVLGCSGDDPRLELADDQVAIEYIGHAAFRFHAPSGHRIVVDPFGDRLWISYAYPDVDLVGADAVFVTHPHYDHDGGVSQGLLFPYADAPHTEPGDTEVGAFSISGLPGRHARNYGAAFGHLNTVWRIRAAGITIVHWGDNDADVTTLAAELGDVDVLMLPIDSLEHILYFEEVEAIRAAIRPRVLVPMHYRLDGIEETSVIGLRLGNIEPWLQGHDGSMSDDFTPGFECDPDDETMCEVLYPQIPAQQRVVRVDGHRKTVDAQMLPPREAPEVWVFEPSPDLR